MKKILAFFLCLVMVAGLIPGMAFAAEKETTTVDLAEDLKALGLFKGVSDTDFALDRAPTRVEAIVMLIRVLGKESTALANDYKHPFTDVPQWADKYVGYAYENKLTNGVSATKFGSENSASAAMYITFVLRALGYSDANGADFKWDNPFDLARSIGVMNGAPDIYSFLREDVVLVSYAALDAKVKNGNTTLAEKLIAAGAFSKADFEKYYDASVFEGGKVYQNAKKATISEEVYFGAIAFVFGSVDAQYQQYGISLYDSLDMTNMAGQTLAELIDERAVELIKEIEAVRVFAEKEGVELTEDDLTAFEILKQNAIDSMGGYDAFKQMLEAESLTVEFFDYYTKYEMLFDSLLRKCFYDDGKYAVSEDEILNQYKSDYALVKHVLIQADETAPDYAEKKALAEDIAKRAKNGENFEALIKQYGEDPGMEAYTDGYALDKDGYTPEGSQMISEFTVASHKLRENEVSGAVKTAYGFHIIKRYPIDATYIKNNLNAIEPAFVQSALDEHIYKYRDMIALDFSNGCDKYGIKDLLK